MPQLLLDVRELGVKLILFRSLCFVQAGVQILRWQSVLILPGQNSFSVHGRHPTKPG